MKSAPILLEIELKLTSSRSPWRHPIQAWRDRRSLKRIRRSVEAELETLLSPGQRHKRDSEDPDDER